MFVLTEKTPAVANQSGTVRMGFGEKSEMDWKTALLKCFAKLVKAAALQPADKKLLNADIVQFVQSESLKEYMKAMPAEPKDYSGSRASASASAACSSQDKTVQAKTKKRRR